jgi:hypothetical protein
MTWGDREITVIKMGGYMPISDELAMEYGLIPDTRPPVVIPRRQRIRNRVDELRLRLGSWVAGVELRDEDYE